MVLFWIYHPGCSHFADGGWVLHSPHERVGFFDPPQLGSSIFWGMLPFSTWVANRVFTLSPFRTYSSPQSPTSFFSLWGWKYQGGVPTALTLKIQPKNVLNVQNPLRMAKWVNNPSKFFWTNLIWVNKPEVIFRTPRAFPYVQALH